MKKCSICNSEINEEFGKIKGTLLKIKEAGQNMFIGVCSECQKQDDWIEKAKIKSA